MFEPSSSSREARRQKQLYNRGDITIKDPTTGTSSWHGTLANVSHGGNRKSDKTEFWHYVPQPRAPSPDQCSIAQTRQNGGVTMPVTVTSESLGLPAPSPIMMISESLQPLPHSQLPPSLPSPHRPPSLSRLLPSSLPPLSPGPPLQAPVSPSESLAADSDSRDDSELIQRTVDTVGHNHDGHFESATMTAIGWPSPSRCQLELEPQPQVQASHDVHGDDSGCDQFQLSDDQQLWNWDDFIQFPESDYISGSGSAVLT